MMKNGIHFIVIALLAAEMFKILICDVTRYTRHKMMEYL